MQAWGVVTGGVGDRRERAVTWGQGRQRIQGEWGAGEGKPKVSTGSWGDPVSLREVGDPEAPPRGKCLGSTTKTKASFSQVHSVPAQKYKSALWKQCLCIALTTVLTNSLETTGIHQKQPPRPLPSLKYLLTPLVPVIRPEQQHTRILQTLSSVSSRGHQELSIYLGTCCCPDSSAEFAALHGRLLEDVNGSSLEVFHLYYC